MDNGNNGGEAMQLPRKGAMEWNLNTVVMIGGLLVSFGVNMFVGGMAYSSITTKQEDLQKQIAEEKLAREKRSISTDGRFAAIEQKIPQFEVIAMQIQRLTEISAANEKAIQATNERFSRYVESQSGKLDLIISRVSDLTTEVRVVQSQLKDGGASRTRFPVLRGK